MRPFNNSGVFFSPGVTWRVSCSGFLKIELLFPAFFDWGAVSLQRMTIRQNKNTWYSRSMSDLVTVRMSWSKSSPKLATSWPFQSSTLRFRFLMISTFSAFRVVSLMLSVTRLTDAWPSSSSSKYGYSTGDTAFKRDWWGHSQSVILWNM